jgi:hypothetical protein
MKVIKNRNWVEYCTLFLHRSIRKLDVFGFHLWTDKLAKKLFSLHTPPPPRRGTETVASNDVFSIAFQVYHMKSPMKCILAYDYFRHCLLAQPFSSAVHFWIHAH